MGRAAKRFFLLSYVAVHEAVHGPKRRLTLRCGKVANGGITDAAEGGQSAVRDPERTFAFVANGSFDHLVGERENFRRKLDSKPLGGLEVDD